MISFYGLPLDYLDNYQQNVQGVYGHDDVKQPFQARPSRRPDDRDRGCRLNSAHHRRLLSSPSQRFPDSEGLRPTPDRVRETLFNWLGQDLAGEHCLDLFAGSGALGFEALSRAPRTGRHGRTRNRKVLAALRETPKCWRTARNGRSFAGMRYNIWPRRSRNSTSSSSIRPFAEGWIPRLEPLLAGVANEDAAVIEAEHEVAGRATGARCVTARLAKSISVVAAETG